MQIAALDVIDTREKAEAGVAVPLLDLAGNPIKNALKEPLTVTVLGTDSKGYTDASRSVTRARLARQEQRKGDGPPTDEELDASKNDSIDLLVAVTTDWSGFIDADKKAVKFTKVGAIDLYKSYPVVREQIDRAVADRTRFTKA